MRSIRLGWNAVPKSARKAVAEVFDSGQYSPGPKVKEFEEKFAALHKAEHGVFVNSGTDALRLALLALKAKYSWGHGQTVLVPSVTFVATVNVVMQAGLTPKLVDVSPIDYTINPELIKNAINHNVVAVMPVHLFGQSCDPEVFAIARAFDLKVVEDSCETILNPLQGNVSCHSTYMAHHLTTGVGGIAVTNDMELNLYMRSFGNHGRNMSYLPGYFVPELGRNLLESRFRFDREGYSSRGTEFEAVLGLSQLPDLSKQVEKRREIGTKIFKAMNRMLMFRPPLITQEHTLMMYPIVIIDAGIDKYDLCLHLEQNGIETRDLMPIVGQPCFRGFIPHDYPVAVDLGKMGFYIPCHPGMTDEDVEQIKNAFTSYGRR